MGKGDFMTPKAIANRMKSKGLQKLRWYCQMCEKQCRDENGFKCHCASESHQRQMKVFGENPKKFIESFSQEFKGAFLKQLSTAHGTKRVFANRVYQELISDRVHLHMNATRWSSLTEFVMYLGKEGYVHLDETEKGWYITWIDNSPEALARQSTIQKKEKQEVTDEERLRKLLEEQIKKSKEKGEEKESEFTELKRENEEQPLKLNLNLKKSAFNFGSKPQNVFKRTSTFSNPLKGKSLPAEVKEKAPSSHPEIKEGASSASKKPLSQLEAIILEEKSKRRKY
ncbi:hypothetical protein DSO57_1036834 [Entomophthora muscae]|uniref:Uncharacterized protein n=2 Tax=Entomophthora muscae TaxID=34485 RepID=A0ACC2TLX5_9FUNG|nr:hypothetical protein DSO57_1002562 [Entomophthora muscae]KAJ9075371.1 hypothetical protein DSO57_1036834 [Entomophthora muscae]